MVHRVPSVLRSHDPPFPPPLPRRATQLLFFSPTSGWKCSKCDMRENLWLNLTDGSILCGRRYFDGSGGNNHAVEHFKETGYPLAVKLGTITPDGAGTPRPRPPATSPQKPLGLDCYSCRRTRVRHEFVRPLDQ